MSRVLTVATGALCAMLAAAGCRTARSARSDVPALIVHPDAESRTALAKAVCEALGGVPVTLADDALTQTSTLVVDRAHPRDARGLPLQGRELGRPERFHLMIDGGACVLVHEEDGRRSPLPGTTCTGAAGRVRDGPGN